MENDLYLLIKKGGCGKTITAISLALALAQKAIKLRLADADNQKICTAVVKAKTRVRSADSELLTWRHEKSIGEVPKALNI